MNEIRAIVIFAKPWRFVDENTGQVREGVSLEYLMTDSLSPIENDDGSAGYMILKESVGIDKMNQIVEVPGIYDITYGFELKKGKPVMKIKGMKFVSGVLENGDR